MLITCEEVWSCKKKCTVPSVCKSLVLSFFYAILHIFYWLTIAALCTSICGVKTNKNLWNRSKSASSKAVLEDTGQNIYEIRSLIDFNTFPTMSRYRYNLTVKKLLIHPCHFEHTVWIKK